MDGLFEVLQGLGLGAHPRRPLQGLTGSEAVNLRLDGRETSPIHVVRRIKGDGEPGIRSSLHEVLDLQGEFSRLVEAASLVAILHRNAFLGPETLAESRQVLHTAVRTRIWRLRRNPLYDGAGLRRGRSDGLGTQVAFHLGTRRGIMEQFVGLDDPLEDAIETRCECADALPKVAVRVVIAGKGEVGPLDAPRVRVTLDAQELEVVQALQFGIEGQDPRLEFRRKVEVRVDALVCTSRVAGGPGPSLARPPAFDPQNAPR